MKKVFFSIIFIAILIICVIAVKISSNNSEKSEIAKFNSQFDEHLGKTMDSDKEALFKVYESEGLNKDE